MQLPILKEGYINFVCDYKIHFRFKSKLIRGTLLKQASQNQNAKRYGHHFAKFAYLPYVPRPGNGDFRNTSFIRILCAKTPLILP